jgi:hypothetical protein
MLSRRAHPKSGTRRRQLTIILIRTGLGSLVRQREPSHGLRICNGIAWGGSQPHGERVHHRLPAVNAARIERPWSIPRLIPNA